MEVVLVYYSTEDFSLLQSRDPVWPGVGRTCLYLLDVFGHEA